MRGAKRFSVSEPGSFANDSAFWNKKVTIGPAVDNSQHQSMALDSQRAESCQQHVRALNTQFASWVQTQLKNHPDELWEDGIRDYLAHASNIMEKFSDVVNWLQKNSSKGTTLLSATNSQVTKTKSTLEVKSNDVVKPFQGQSGHSPTSLTTTTTSFASLWSSGPFSTTQNSKSLLTNSQTSNSQSSGAFSSGPSFGLFSTNPSSGAVSSNSQSSPLFSNTQSSPLFSNTQSSGLSFGGQNSKLFSNSQSPAILSNNKSPGLVFSNNQSSVLFGNQTSVPATNRDASDDMDGENEEEQPGSPSVKKSEEQGISVVHEVKCKLYLKSSDPSDKDPWKDKGTGKLSIKCKEGVDKGSKESKPTIIVRNDVGRILLNALLYPGIKTNTQKNSIVAIFHTAGDGDGNDIAARTFLIRLKTEDDRNKLATVIQDYAPSS